jgi:hypothetical protein
MYVDSFITLVEKVWVRELDVAEIQIKLLEGEPYMVLV